MRLPYFQSATILKLSGIAEKSPDEFKSAESLNKIINSSGGIKYSNYISAEPIPELDPSSKNDASNAKKIHKWICSFNLPRATLSDNRLWSALSLDIFQGYTLLRWSKNPEIRTRYLTLGSSQRALIRNSISRLFWSAELTARREDYSLTDTVFFLQDIQQGLLERAFCVNKDIVHKSLLHMELNKGTLKKETIQKYTRFLNNAGGTTSLAEVANSMIPKIYDRSKNPVKPKKKAKKKIRTKKKS